VFYQSTSAEAGLLEIQERIGGRLRRRGSMSDVTITNRQAIRSLLTEMQPYVIFKQLHVREGLKLLDRLPPPKSPAGFLEVCEGVDRFASLNFSKSRTVTSLTVRNYFEGMGLLAPVTTDPKGEARLTIFDDEDPN
jgi:hypothetical protein